MKNFIVWMYLALVYLNISGCVSQPTQYPTLPYPMKFQLNVIINGKSFIGTGVIPKASKYLITTKSPVKTFRFTIASCHREFSIDNVNDDSFTTTIYPTDIENNSSVCPFRVFSYNREIPENNLFAYFDTYDSTMKLRASLACNGYMYGTESGVSLCSGPLGSNQRITFQVPVVYSKKTTCFVQTEDNKRFDFFPKKDQCIVIFKDQSTGDLHRLTILGY